MLSHYRDGMYMGKKCQPGWQLTSRHHNYKQCSAGVRFLLMPQGHWLIGRGLVPSFKGTPLKCNLSASSCHFRRTSKCSFYKCSRNKTGILRWPLRRGLSAPWQSCVSLGVHPVTFHRLMFSSWLHKWPITNCTDASIRRPTAVSGDVTALTEIIRKPSFRKLFVFVYMCVCGCVLCECTLKIKIFYNSINNTTSM